MPVTVQVDERQANVQLNELRSAVTDTRPLLNIVGEVMRGSIAKTFREEGSPAGSWPKLAISTLRNRKYTSGHKLLIMSGRLFGSISYTSSADALTIGTNVPYAAVHQFGSADYRGGLTGPLTREQHAAYEAERVNVPAHMGSRLRKLGMGSTLRTDKRGVVRRVHVRIVGPQNRTQFEVRAHKRHQNIPPRPFLVFRPEDPGRMAEAISIYIAGKAGAARTAGA